MFDWLRKIIHGLRTNPPPVVAVLRLAGPIGANGRFQPGITMTDTAKLISQAFQMPGVTAVALAINSPGGAPVQSALIMRRIRDLATEKDIPVIAFTEDVAASGGYLLALAGDEIYAHEASIVGSIGVIYSGFGFVEAMEKLGVERRLFTAGDKKALLDPFSPKKNADEARLKELQVDIHDYFKSLVKERRGRKLKGTQKKMFSGDVWLGHEATKLGLVDGVGELRPVLRERFGDDVKIRLIAQRRPRLARLFGGFRGKGGESGGDMGGTWSDDLLASVEARLMWNRFGL